MGKTNFQSLKELSNSLKIKIDKLSNGSINLEEIEVLTEEVRELYERVVIIRYKSYEENNKGSHQIEEEHKAVQEVENKIPQKDADEELMMFDFSTEDNSIEENTIEPETIPNPILTNEDESSAQKQSIGAETNDNSLNDNFKKTDGSVAAKFTQSAINDLKEHIGINRKFLYVNELFNGDSTAYNEAINQLNSCGSSEAALNLLSSLRNTQNWDRENSTVAGFEELVERRYIK